ncbi:MAG: bifunctional hydroxymethylpyrimidine kinase/phosphomethylpyrimidine kinase, partial [Clostridia bacterium]|nr:bifunctional hydroxymethylpyrimidine kinase/phosphomethylpyrimidine kinase [Clostridia bacterium]
DALEKAGMKNVILTGISYTEATTGVVVKVNGKTEYYSHRRLPVGSHGTGDVFASAFTGALLRGKSEYGASKVAANYTLRCIENTVGDENHKYGVKFETAIPYLLTELEAE